ncbi:uncharacterized protein METZ01_LOCUS416987, partial [marine metagenome]
MATSTESMAATAPLAKRLAKFRLASRWCFGNAAGPIIQFVMHKFALLFLFIGL